MRALRDGWCEVNLAPLNVDEVAQLAETLEGVAGGGLACLRLLCVFRGLKERTVPKPGLQRWSADEDTRVDQFATLRHRRGLKEVTDVVTHERVRKRLPRMLELLVRRSKVLGELQIGFCPSWDVGRRLAKSLSLNESLTTLSFAGSHMGDQTALQIVSALKGHTKLEQLELASCALTDTSGVAIAGLIKAHASRRSVVTWQADLRRYPGGRGGSAAGAASAAAAGVSAEALEEEERARKLALHTCGGLMTLNLSDNQFTGKSVAGICNALLHDVRLVTLNLRRNRLDHASLEDLVNLLKEHPRLSRVDVRENIQGVGILRGPGFSKVTDGILDFEMSGVHEEHMGPQSLVLPPENHTREVPGSRRPEQSAEVSPGYEDGEREGAESGAPTATATEEEAGVGAEAEVEAGTGASTGTERLQNAASPPAEASGVDAVTEPGVMKTLLNLQRQMQALERLRQREAKAFRKQLSELADENRGLKTKLIEARTAVKASTPRHTPARRTPRAKKRPDSAGRADGPVSAFMGGTPASAAAARQQQLKAAAQKTADGPDSPEEFMACDLAADIQKHLEREFDLG